VLRPRFPGHPRHGAVKIPPPGAHFEPQPLAHMSCVALLKLEKIEFGREFLEWLFVLLRR
jgi:hypothetical protein